jgi:hypothetical protein
MFAGAVKSGTAALRRLPVQFGKFGELCRIQIRNGPVGDTLIVPTKDVEPIHDTFDGTVAIRRDCGQADDVEASRIY